MSIKDEPIPEGVVNVKEYHKYLAFSRHPVVRNTIYVSSEGDEINIAMLPSPLKKRISHLSPSEQEHVLALKARYSKYRGYIAVSKAKAFGSYGNADGLKETPKKALTPYEEDVVELLGRLFTVPEVVKIMWEDNGIETREGDVLDIMKKHIGEIERRREDFRNRVLDVRLYNKRPRLEELAWMYSRLKSRYILLNGTEVANTMLRVLEQIRKEAEGDVININGAIDINIDATIQNHIAKEAFKTINLKEIILGRIAARMNYDVKKLVAGLHNSYYANFVEISGNFDPNAEMTYPSSKTYDFAEIERTAGREVVDVTPEEVSDEETARAKSVREMFLEKIKKQKEEQLSRVSTYDERARKRDAETPDTETPIKRSRGRSFDKQIPSKSFEGKKKNRGKDYRTGEKKE